MYIVQQSINMMTSYKWSWSAKTRDMRHSQWRQINTHQGVFFQINEHLLIFNLSFHYSTVCLFSPTAVFFFFKFNSRYYDFLFSCRHLKCYTNSSWQDNIYFAEKDVGFGRFWWIIQKWNHFASIKTLEMPKAKRLISTSCSTLRRASICPFCAQSPRIPTRPTFGSTWCASLTGTTSSW